jgi:multicomponent Na+:H+ antiporter subunit G
VTLALQIASWVCLLGGGLLCIVGTLGLVRMPDFYTRVHAASIVDTLGAGLVLLGLLLQAGLTLVGAKLVLLGLLLLFASPTATHALVRAALHRGLAPQLAPDSPYVPETAPQPAGDGGAPSKR